MKNALITGANKGIGFEIACQLSAKGFYVFLTSRSGDKGKDALQRFKERGGKGELILLDVNDETSIAKAQEEVNKKVDTVDVLINNAAILLDHYKDILDGDGEKFISTLQTNVVGAFLVTKHFYPMLKKGSRVIMVSSGAGRISQVSPFAPMYSISKTALNSLMLQLHLKFSSDGIIINSMCPGWVRTDMGGKDAAKDVSEGARTAVWLAVEASESIQGKFIHDEGEEYSW